MRNLNRRDVIKGVASAASLGVLGQGVAEETALRGNIKQSIAFWCFANSEEKWSLEQTCEAARALGCGSVELLRREEQLALVKEQGLECAMVSIDPGPGFPFIKGYNNPANWEMLVRVTKAAIDLAAKYGAPNTICFTGFSAKDPADPNSPLFSLEEGAENCVQGLKKVIGYAEKKGVNLCLEPLNTRDDTHPMKGHPGYQGDRLDYCMDIIRRVNSERMKVLFDIYHTQVMDGDVIRRLGENIDFIGHVHTAGNPGRGELVADEQEIDYANVMKALVKLGYDGFVGHEYIPTGSVMQGLREAVRVCDA
ncbi:MAG: TIM barrel protein [Verrucomicrobiota bacterium]